MRAHTFADLGDFSTQLELFAHLNDAAEPTIEKVFDFEHELTKFVFAASPGRWFEPSPRRPRRRAASSWCSLRTRVQTSPSSQREFDLK
jgi:hypothetical protein